MSTDLHVAFPKAPSAAVRAEAAKRGVRPQVLVVAAMKLACQHDLLDAIFDGLDPHGVAGGHARRVNGMTHLQCGVIYLMALHADAQGVCIFSTHDYARLIKGASPSGVGSALHWLTLRGLADRTMKPTFRSAQPYYLTREGRAVAAELTGFEP